MDHRAEIKEFLSSRRARLSPEQAGLPVYGGNRRVKGLRREEVALLAGVSVDYYVRLERGNLAGASESVLEALVRALQLDDAERDHLFALARESDATPVRRRTPTKGVRPALQQVLEAITDAPAWIRNAQFDILAANKLSRALYASLFADPHPNTARFTFLDPAAQEFFVDWERAADDIAAVLRLQAGQNPHDKALSDLIGELSTRSETFRTRWADHNVRFHRSGRKKLHHPVVGNLEIDFEAMEFPSDPGLTMVVYTAPANTPTADALKLLASWAATQQSDEHGVPDQR
ncbi:helix-turn-helix transcriptional regulator [Kribbella sp. GL6]|uniref:helix-turn-helix transcriptional regulator n=1 Tax=Kribbella sp. GL6 TaxID=3419765 RepID=UPI003D059A57